MSHLFWLLENLNQSNWIEIRVYITWSINRKFSNTPPHYTFIIYFIHPRQWEVTCTPCHLPTISFMCQFYLHGIGNVYQGFLFILMVQEWDATKTELMVRCSGRHKLSNCAWFKLNLSVSNQGPNWNFFLLSSPSITRKLVEDLVPSELTIV